MSGGHPGRSLSCFARRLEFGFDLADAQGDALRLGLKLLEFLAQTSGTVACWDGLGKPQQFALEGSDFSTFNIRTQQISLAR
jgi:hypothetical protein